MEKPRFIVDVNVGRLAKWLRVMGYDTLFPTENGDNELVRVALRENRIIVTRDSGLVERRVVTTGRLKVVLIQRDDIKNQLRQLVCLLELDGRLEGRNEFSRCIRCNEPLISLTMESARDRVPPYVYETQREFMECPVCLRMYWRGTHWANMQSELARLRD